MTNLPAEIELFPSTETWGLMKQQASVLVQGGFLPHSIKTPEQAISIMLAGRELGIPPMEAFSSISVIKGKPTKSPELMLKLILRMFPTTKITYKVMNNEKCEMVVTRPGQEPQEFCFSMADAKQAGLASKDNWKNYTRAMLRSRCIGEMARALFPDAISGSSYTPEEIEHLPEDGAIVIEPTASEKAKPGDIQLMFNAWNHVNSVEMDSLKHYLKENFGMSSTKDMTTKQTEQTIEWIKSLQPEHTIDYTEPEIESMADSTPNALAKHNGEVHA